MVNIKQKGPRRRLWKALQHSYSELRPFREHRRALLERYTSSWPIGEDKKKRPTMLPLVAQTANAYMQALVASNPRVIISTHDQELRGFSHHYTAAINNLIKEIKFADELRLATLDAFFFAGFMKIYWAPGEPVEIEDPDKPKEPGLYSKDEEWDQYTKRQHNTIWVDPGKPMIERISPDDFTFDMTATKWSSSRFMAHEYDVPLSVLEEDDRVDKKMLKTLPEWSRWKGSLFSGGGDRADQLHESSGSPVTLEPMIRVADLYMPFERCWGMMASNGEMLFVDDYEGPEGGMYRMLSFDDVPDSIPGIAPGMHLMHLHDLQNSLFRKQANQAKRQKEVIGYLGDREDANTHKNSPDGEYIRLGSENGLVPMQTGGPSQVNLAFGQLLDGVFNDVAGNPDAMSGRGPSAKTASQEQLIHARMAGREEKMRERIISLTQGLSEDLALMLWVDEQTEMRGEYTIPGIDEPIAANWTPEDREGDFIQYRVTVEPYSMQYQSPQMRSQALTGLLQQVIMPVMPMLQQQGGTIDAAALTDMLSELNDLPRLKELVKFTAPMAPPPGQQQQPANPNTGPRHYVRESVSNGGSPDAQRVQNMQALMYGGQNQNQGGAQP